MDVDHQVDQKVPLPQSIVALMWSPGQRGCLRPPPTPTRSKSPLPELSGALQSPLSARNEGWPRIRDLEAQQQADPSRAPSCR